MYQNEEHRKRVIERGDGYGYIGSYKLNEVTIDGKCGKGKYSYIRVKCPYCGKEYDVALNGFARGNKSKCNYCCNFYENSFAYYIQVELGEGLNEHWLWDKNNSNPYLISKGSKNKIILKCNKKDYHDNYVTYAYKFSSRGDRCPQCAKRSGKIHPKDSFGQWLINEFGDDAIEKYWSSKNTLDPFKISKRSTNKVFMLCQDKNYHNNKGGYKITCDSFYSGSRCGFCHTSKTHPKDSFASIYPEKAKYWSKNNNKSPYEISPMSNKKYKFICEKCGNEFKRTLNHLNKVDTGVICKKCHSSQGETKILRWLDENNIYYIYDKPYFNDLIGVGNNPLKPDFILPNKRLWIEYDGRQHFELQIDWQNEEGFKRLKEHDRRKDEYAKEHNWKLIRIPYWEFDNIEEILEKEINKNN